MGNRDSFSREGISADESGSVRLESGGEVREDFDFFINMAQGDIEDKPTDDARSTDVIVDGETAHAGTWLARLS